MGWARKMILFSTRHVTIITEEAEVNMTNDAVIKSDR
jgi:hypothetical protein